jgi:hypothetical protein
MTLIPLGEITQIEANLQQAATEIQRRQQAKQVLDGVVQTVIIAARGQGRRVIAGAPLDSGRPMNSSDA